MAGGRSRARTASVRLGLVLGLTLAACSRSGFVGTEGNSDDDFAPGAGAGGGGGGADVGPVRDSGWSPPGADPDAEAADASVALDGALPPPVGPTPTSTAEPVPTGTTTSRPPVRPPPRCVPASETCNGRDDDCNGQIDDDIVPIPCPDGGERYCVDGRYSACPDRCEVCIPGSERVCFLSYCTFWAKQICAADGRSWGVCREDPVPRECKQIAERHEDSPQLEQCCIDNGYCCRDEFDLDGDGSRNDMVGACDEVACR